MLQTIRSNVERRVVNFIVNWTPCIEVTTVDDEEGNLDFIEVDEAVEFSVGGEDVHRDQ